MYIFDMMLPVLSELATVRFQRSELGIRWIIKFRRNRSLQMRFLYIWYIAGLFNRILLIIYLINWLTSFRSENTTGIATRERISSLGENPVITLMVWTHSAFPDYTSTVTKAAIIEQLRKARSKASRIPFKWRLRTIVTSCKCRAQLLRDNKNQN